MGPSKVWQFLTRTADTVRLVTKTAAWSSRKDPMVLSTSDNSVYMLGGHNCEDETCTDDLAQTDVWMSIADSTNTVGESWTCQTANYDTSLKETYSKGVGWGVAYRTKRHPQRQLTHVRHDSVRPAARGPRIRSSPKRPSPECLNTQTLIASGLGSRYGRPGILK